MAASIDADRAELFIYVYKEGALSALGHDLKLRASSFELEASPDAVRLEVPLEAIEVMGSIRNGRIQAGELSEKDKRDIKKNMTKDVLQTRKHPRATFTANSVEAAGEGFQMEGTLNLHGVSKTIKATAAKEEGALVAKVPILLTDYGMKPYKALLGAIKTRAEILVELRAPLSDS